MRSLRILFVTNNFTPYSGGVVSSIQTTVRELQKLGHEVQIVTLQFVKQDNTDPKNVLRIPCPITFMRKQNPMAIPWRSTNYLKKAIIQFKPDIIHAHHPFLLGTAALKAAKSFGIPIVFTYHTLYQHYTHYVPLPHKLTIWGLSKWVPVFCNAVDGIIAPSNTVKTMIEDSFVEKPITVIPSALQEPFLPTKKFCPKPKHDRFRLLLVSRLVREKNIFFLIDLFAKLSQATFSFTIVGYGDEYESLCNYAYHKLKLSSGNLRFIHKPDKSTIRNAYAEHDLFLFSSTSDTQAIVLAESMAAGTPIIALDGPGQRDIIAHGENGYIVNTESAMIGAIKTIANDDSLQQKLQHNAWHTAHRYLPKQTVSQLVEFYQSFCSF